MLAPCTPADALVEKQRQGLVDMHKNGCPWKTRQCDGMAFHLLLHLVDSVYLVLASIYRIPLKSPAVLIRDIKSNAQKMDTLLEGVNVKHPLVTTITLNRLLVY
jgi:hypothetical protein